MWLLDSTQKRLYLGFYLRTGYTGREKVVQSALINVKANVALAGGFYSNLAQID